MRGGLKGKLCVRVCVRLCVCDLDIHLSAHLSVSIAKCLNMVPWRGRDCVQQRRLFRWGRSAKACWTHNDIENKQCWMGTWSPRNHRTLNGKSLSSSEQPGSRTTGRPRRRGVKVHLLCVSVCVCMCVQHVAHFADQLHISTNTWQEGMDTLEWTTPKKQTEINLTPTRAQTRRWILSYKYTLSLSLTYTLNHRRGGLPNQPPATILSCHSLSPGWLMKTKEGPTVAAHAAPRPGGSCGITTCGQCSC